MSRLALALSACTLAGCALMRKSEPLHVRYFVPDEAAPSAGASTSDGPTLHLRLGRVVAGPQLGQRIMVRRGPGELAYYDDLRWTERPDAYLRRALSSALFERDGVVRIVAGPGPTLDVELLAFEELPGHEARFSAVLSVYGEREQLATRSVERRVKLVGDGPAALVRGLSRALSEGVAEIAHTAEAALRSAPAAPGPGGVSSREEGR